MKKEELGSFLPICRFIFTIFNINFYIIAIMIKSLHANYMLSTFCPFIYITNYYYNLKTLFYTVPSRISVLK